MQEIAYVCTTQVVRHSCNPLRSCYRCICVYVRNVQVDISKAVALCRLMESMVLGSSEVSLTEEPAKLHPVLCTVFFFSYVWCIGGNITDAGFEVFDGFVRDMFADNRDVRVSCCMCCSFRKSQLCKHAGCGGCIVGNPINSLTSMWDAVFSCIMHSIVIPATLQECQT